MYFVYVLLVTVSMAIVLINFQPYKLSVAHYTTIDVFLVLLSLFYVTIVGNNVTTSSGKKDFLTSGCYFMYHSNHLHELHCTTLDILQKEMGKNVLNEDKYYDEASVK